MYLIYSLGEELPYFIGKNVQLVLPGDPLYSHILKFSARYIPIKCIFPIQIRVHFVEIETC